MTHVDGVRVVPRTKMTKSIALLAALAVLGLVSPSAWAQKRKNWSPPAGKIYAQAIIERVMKSHPELVLIGLHGIPPGGAPHAYTMIGSSYPDRVGNADDPDDMMVSEGGITILEPPHKTDPVKEFGYMAPLRDGTGMIVGSIVLGFKRGDMLTDVEVLQQGNAIRSAVERQVPAYSSYFRPAG